ncbi:hypothetical protein HK101_012047, partial [Irineochytrium annulatum]
METFLTQLQDLVQDLHSVSLFRTSQPLMDEDIASLHHLASTVDDLDRRAQAARKQVDDERHRIAVDGARTLRDLDRAIAALEGMVVKAPRHMPKIDAGTLPAGLEWEAAAAAVDAEVETVENGDDDAASMEAAEDVRE